jgi:hypothetical protein
MAEYPYILKGPSIEDLNGELDHFWKDLHTNTDLKDHIKAKGMDVGKFAVRERSDSVFIRASAAQFHPGEGLDILVSFAPEIRPIARRLWDSILLPRLGQKFGENSIRPR